MLFLFNANYLSWFLQGFHQQTKNVTKEMGFQSKKALTLVSLIISALSVPSELLLEDQIQFWLPKITKEMVNVALVAPRNEYHV